MTDIRQMPFRKRIEHIWEYYKLALVLIGIVLYIVIYILYRYATATDPVLYLGLVNVSAGESLMTELTGDFIAAYPEEDGSGGHGPAIVKTYTDLLLTENVSKDEGSYVYAAQMKILASIDGQLFDLVILDQEAFDAFAQNGYLYNMGDFLLEEKSNLSPDLYERLTSSMVSNIEILEDNYADVRLDSSIPYQSVTTEYPMALELKDCRIIRQAGFPQTLYLGIIKNSPRLETVSHYITYLFE